MIGEVEAEAPRPRPLSGGLWTLFSWLRRDEHSSSDSLSSAGSDRTVASFAFLAAPRTTARAPSLSPSAPTTDTYKKRVRDRNIRRQHDRDLTLHRKYGLYRCDGTGYDAFSLPPARRHLGEAGDRQDRGRRAASECCGPRAAHVPGKRRAPPPPAPPAPPAATASLTRRHTRKRRAPQPPAKILDKTEGNRTQYREKFAILVEMNSKSDRDGRPMSTGDVTTGCKSEKYSKKDSNLKESKPRREKSFLRQIFENRKRNSAVEPSPGKILPNISELDKQAAEIIESCKLRALEQNNNLSGSGTASNGDTWICTKCLRKYNSAMVVCLYCLPDPKRSSNGFVKDSLRTATSSGATIFTQTDNLKSPKLASTSRVSGVGVDEKEKLKEMLKEMKDSLPIKTKNHQNVDVARRQKVTASALNSSDTNVCGLETPTLRIGSAMQDDDIDRPATSTSAQSPTIKNHNPTNDKQIITIHKDQDRPSEAVVITQHVVLVGPQPKKHDRLVGQGNNKKSDKDNHSAEDNLNIAGPSSVVVRKVTEEKNKETPLVVNNVKKNLHTPLKISSLLNPVYIPKNPTPEAQSKRNLFFENVDLKKSDTQFGRQTSPTNAITIANKKSLISSSALSSKPITAETTPKEKGLVVQTETIEIKKIDLKTSPNEHKVPDILLSTVAVSTSSNTQLSNKPQSNNSNVVKFSVDQHFRRRHLINQLEQSIAKGDEHAAAEAASKLAQLRLSCSVLSFSSQLIGDSSKTAANFTQEDNVPLKQSIEAKLKTPEQPRKKVDIAVQSIASVSCKEKCKQPVNDEKKQENQKEIQENRLPSSANKAEISASKELSKIKTNSKLESAGPSASRLPNEDNGNNLIPIVVWVEDREATRGPVRLRIARHAAMGDLRRRAEASLGLAAGLQRWIVGRALCTDDTTPLVSLAGPDLTAPFYLCVVQSETNEDVPATNADIIGNKVNEPNTKEQATARNVYSELVLLEQWALVPNAERFECGVCMEDCAPGGGAVLRDCVHAFCRECLADLVHHCQEPLVSCPAMGCPGALQEREIRTLVSADEYERWLARGLAAAESGTRNAFHCRTRDCTGWALCDPGVRRFPCPVCKSNNCVPCQAIHEGESCDQHRAKLQTPAATPDGSQPDENTQALLDALISKGEALRCPECSAIITKKWGCDWVKCSACKTEICWVTRGRRWGPAGRGDTSGGCRCGVDGQRCHPSCGYCH